MISMDISNFETIVKIQISYIYITLLQLNTLVQKLLKWQVLQLDKCVQTLYYLSLYICILKCSQSQAE